MNTRGQGIMYSPNEINNNPSLRVMYGTALQCTTPVPQACSWSMWLPRCSSLCAAELLLQNQAAGAISWLAKGLDAHTQTLAAMLSP